MRERLCDTYRETGAKAGKQRAELDVILCWASWLACILDGWQWRHMRMDDPACAERLWMAIAIATWWLLSVGGEAEDQADTPLDIKDPSVPGAAARKTLAAGRHFPARLVFDHRGLA